MPSAVPDAARRRVQARVRRRWDESQHPRDSRGRFTHKGTGAAKWVGRVLAQANLGMGTMRASTNEADVNAFFGVAEGMRPNPAPPRREGPGPVIDVSRNAAVFRIRRTAAAYRGAPGTSEDAKVARTLVAPRLEQIATDVEAGRLTPGQAAGRVLGAASGSVWRPGSEGRTPADVLAEQLDGGPRPVARPNPETAVLQFDTEEQVARVAREMTADDLRSTPLERAAYGADLRLLQRMTAGPSADQYRDSQRTATAERLLAARESVSQGGADPSAQALRGMLDFWNGGGYSAERQSRLESAGSAGRAPVIVEPPRRQEWGQAPNALPTATNPRSDTTVDTRRVTRETGGMTPPATQAPPVQEPTPAPTREATQPRVTRKQLAQMHRWNDAGNEGSTDTLFINERQALIDAGYVEDAGPAALSSTIRRYRLTDAGRARLEASDPEAYARRTAAAERKRARQEAAAEARRVADEKRQARLVKDLETADREGLDPSLVRMSGLEYARQRKAEAEAKAAAEAAAAHDRELNLGVPSRQAPHMNIDWLTQQRLMTRFGGPDSSPSTLLGKLRRDNITLTDEEKALLQEQARAHHRALGEVDQANHELRHAIERRDYIATINEIEGGEDYARMAAEAEGDVSAARERLAGRVAAATATGQAITDHMLAVYKARGRRKTARGIGVPMPRDMSDTFHSYGTGLQPRLERTLPYGASTDPRAAELRSAQLRSLRAHDEINSAEQELRQANGRAASALRDVQTYQGYPEQKKALWETYHQRQAEVAQAQRNLTERRREAAEAARVATQEMSRYRALPSVDSIPQETPARAELLQRINAGEGPAFSMIGLHGQRRYVWVERSTSADYPDMWHVMSAYEGQPADRSLMMSNASARANVLDQRRHMSNSVIVDEITGDQAEANARVRDTREGEARAARLDAAVRQARGETSQPASTGETPAPRLVPAQRGDYVVISRQDGGRASGQRHDVYEVAGIDGDGRVTSVRPINGGPVQRVQNMGRVQTTVVQADRVDLAAARDALLNESGGTGVPTFDTMTDVRATFMPHVRREPHPTTPEQPPVAEATPSTPPAPSETEVQAARDALRGEVLNPSNQAAVQSAIDRSAAGHGQFARGQAERQLGTTLGADPLLNRVSELAEQNARQDAVVQSDQTVIDRLDAIANDANETPARRAAAASLAEWGRSNRTQVDDSIAANLGAVERDIRAIGDLNRADAETRGTEAARVRQLNETAAVEAARALAAEHPGIERGMINEDAGQAREFGRESTVAAIRAAQLEDIGRRIDAARSAQEGMHTEEGRAVMQTNLEHLEWERRNLVQQEETARLAADRIRLDLVSNFQRRETARLAEIERQRAMESPSDRELRLDREEETRVMREIEAAIPARNAPVEQIKKAARAEARRLGLSDAAIRRLPYEQQEFARDAMRSIMNAHGAPYVAEHNRERIRVFEERLNDPNLRPATREHLQNILKGLQAGHTRFGTEPVTEEDVAQYARQRDFYVAVWRAASTPNPGSRDSRIDPELLAGLSDAEKRKVYDLASQVGENAALALVQWFRNGRT